MSLARPLPPSACPARLAQGSRSPGQGSGLGQGSPGQGSPSLACVTGIRESEYRYTGIEKIAQIARFSRFSHFRRIPSRTLPSTAQWRAWRIGSVTRRASGSPDWTRTQMATEATNGTNGTKTPATPVASATPASDSASLLAQIAQLQEALKATREAKEAESRALAEERAAVGVNVKDASGGRVKLEGVVHNPHGKAIGAIYSPADWRALARYMPRVIAFLDRTGK